MSVESARMMPRPLVALFAATLALSACGTEPTPQSAVPPAEVLDLADWKLTLPIAGPREGWPLEVVQPQLNTYRSELFEASPDRSSVMFRAPVFGMAQPGSAFARTELREMTADGTKRAAWSNQSGRHSIEIRQRITALPEIRPSIVAGQIHDGEEYVVLVRLDGNRLYVKADNRDIGALDTDYMLGDVFTVRLEAANGRIQIFYDDELKVDYAKSCQSCYFKAGAYLQANPDSAKKRDPGRSADRSDYGEVVISALTVEHSPPL